MTATTPVLDETPVVVPAGREELFAVWSRPTGPANGTAITLLPGAGIVTSVHRNRMFVRLARSLAAQGYHVLRFDWHGVGMSSGNVSSFGLQEPFTDDLAGVIEWIEAQGLAKHVLVGTCFGARTALAGAAAVRSLSAIALVSPPVLDFERGEDTPVEWNARRLARRLTSRDTLRGFLDRDRRSVYRRFATTKVRSVFRTVQARIQGTPPAPRAGVTDGFLRDFEGLVRRRIPVLFLYGEEDGLWKHFEAARAGELDPLLRKAGGLVEVESYAGYLHGFDNLGAQQAVLDRVPQWLGRVTNRGAAR